MNYLSTCLTSGHLPALMVYVNSSPPQCFFSFWGEKHMYGTHHNYIQAFIQLLVNIHISKGYYIFKSALWGGGGRNLFGGTSPHNSILLTPPPPYLHILNSILHLEPPCATPSFHILNYLIPNIPVHYE